MEQLYLTIILTGSAGAIGFILRMFIESINNVLKNKRLTKINHNQFLLSEFYIPIYILLHRENSIWNKIITSNHNKDEIIERLDNEILENHLQIQKIILENIAKASPIYKIANKLMDYDEHVTIFKTLRSINSKDFPIKYGSKYPTELYYLIEDRIDEIKNENKILLGFCGNFPKLYNFYTSTYKNLCYYCNCFRCLNSCLACKADPRMLRDNNIQMEIQIDNLNQAMSNKNINNINKNNKKIMRP